MAIIQAPPFYPEDMDHLVVDQIPFVEMSVDSFKEYLKERFSDYEIIEATEQTFSTLVQTLQKLPGTMMFTASIVHGMVRKFYDITNSVQMAEKHYAPEKDIHSYLFIPKPKALPN
jgi:hypothetical protein